MTQEKAEIAKQKGNEAFKTGDFANAIGFYTSAMVENPKEVAYPLNRAAAYLKLGKNVDAERDCTTALKIAPKNAKALFRRAQAKVAENRLPDAQQDLIEAARYAPNDRSIQMAFTEVQDKIKANREKVDIPYFSLFSGTLKAGQAAGAASFSGRYVEPEGTPSKRRRVPIEIVESPTPITSSLNVSKESTTFAENVNESLTPVSSRSLKDAAPSSAPPSTTNIPAEGLPSPAASEIFETVEKPKSFKEAKEAREAARPTRIGGGIFRSTGANIVFPTRETESSGGSKKPTPSPSSCTANSTGTANETHVLVKRKVPIKTPESLFDLTRTWNSCKTDEERWEVLQTIPPLRFPTICKTSLDPVFLTSIFKMFASMLTVASLETQIQVKEYMEVIPHVQRFPMVWMLLSKEEKDVVRKVLDKLGVGKEGGEISEREREEQLGAWATLLK